MNPFPIEDSVGAWVPHGRFVVDGAPLLASRYRLA